MAEALLRKKAKEKLIVKSAGVYASFGSPAASQTIEVLSERGIEMKHISQPLTDELVGWADLILSMTAGHKQAIFQTYPQALDKTFTLKEFVNEEARDTLDKLQKKYSEYETKRVEALGAGLDAEGLEQTLLPLQKEIIQLENSLPSFDISDPYGGSVDIYRKTRQELDDLLEKLVKKIK